MLTVEQFVRALALTESDDNEHAWGDAGRAMGRFQVHPDWVWTWAKHYAMEPQIGDTWDSFARRLVVAFANDHLRYLSPVGAAMYFHIGHKSFIADPEWDSDYAQRFEACAFKVSNA